eukprot:302326-Hanusia_phi.AAC.1
MQTMTTMPRSLKSGFYLGSFCIASILIMGVFCAFWGEITARASSSNRSRGSASVDHLSLIAELVCRRHLVAGVLDVSNVCGSDPSLQTCKLQKEGGHSGRWAVEKARRGNGKGDGDESGSA